MCHLCSLRIQVGEQRGDRQLLRRRHSCRRALPQGPYYVGGESSYAVGRLGLDSLCGVFLGNVGQQAGFQRFVRAEFLPGKHVSQERARRHPVAQRQRDHRGRETEPDLGDAERRARRGHSEIAGRHEAHPAGTRVAVDDRDNGLVRRQDDPQQVEEDPGPLGDGLPRIGGGSARLGQVCARAERAAGVPEQHHARAGVCRHGREGLPQPRHERCRQCVAVRRCIERDMRGDPFAPVAHGIGESGLLYAHPASDVGVVFCHGRASFCSFLGAVVARQ